MTKLRQRMIEDMQLRGLTPRTQVNHIGHVARFARVFNTSPEHLDLEDIRQFHLHLLNDLCVAASVSSRKPEPVATPSSTVNCIVVPTPSSLSTHMRPSIISTSVDEIDRAEPCSAVLSGDAGIGLREGLKDEVELLRWDTQGEFALHQNPRRLYALTPKGEQRRKFLL